MSSVEQGQTASRYRSANHRGATCHYYLPFRLASSVHSGHGAELAAG